MWGGKGSARHRCLFCYFSLFLFRFVLQRLLSRCTERCCDYFIRYARFIVCCVFVNIAVKRYLLFVQCLRDFNRYYIIIVQAIIIEARLHIMIYYSRARWC